MALRSDNFLLQRYVEKAMVDLPALPTVIVKVLQATEKDTVTTSEIESLLSSDAAMTTKLLKVVNSAYFGLPRQVGNIGQAIAILGMHQVRNLVLSVGVLNALSSPSPRVVEVQKAFWEHSFAAATCSQNLARQRGLSNHAQDLAFVGGLLHDVGRLFLFTLFNQPYQQVMSESAKLGEAIIVTENRVLGTSHAELGGMLADKWNFPTDLAELIRYHEEPERVPNPGNLQLLSCIHASDRLASELWEGPQSASQYPWNQQVVEWLAFGPEEMAALREDVKSYVEQARVLLGVL